MTKVKDDDMIFDLFSLRSELLTKRDREVVNCTRSRVKNKSKLTNFMKIFRIEVMQDAVVETLVPHQWN